MIEYIDRHKAIHAIKEHCEDTLEKLSPGFPIELRSAYIMAHQHCMEVLSLLPASVEEERKHGKWTGIRQGIGIRGRCSECMSYNWITPYCPNCGAKMEAEI